MLSLSRSICDSLRRTPDKEHSPFIVREAWLCVPVIESCREVMANVMTTDVRARRPIPFPAVLSKPKVSAICSAGHKNVIPAMNHCRSCTPTRVSVCGHTTWHAHKHVRWCMLFQVSCSSSDDRVIFLCQSGGINILQGHVFYSLVSVRGVSHVK